MSSRDQAPLNAAEEDPTVPAAGPEAAGQAHGVASGDDPEHDEGDNDDGDGGHDGDDEVEVGLGPSD